MLEKHIETWKNRVVLSVFGTYGFLRHLTANLLLTVFVCLGLLPTGFMPSFARGDATVILCSGLEEKTVTTDDQGQPVHKIEIPCAFSLNVSAAPEVQAVVLTARLYESVKPVFPTTIVVHGIDFGPHPSRAPPAA